MGKKLIKSYIDTSKNIQVKPIIGDINNPKPGTKWKLEVEGEFKDMSNQTTLKSLEKKVDSLVLTIESLATIVQEGFAKVNSRLDVLESDMKDVKKDIEALKNTPTMKKELKNY